MEKVVVAITVDPAYAERHSELVRDFLADGQTIAQAIDGDVSVTLTQDGIVELDSQVEDITDIIPLVANAVSILRDIREGKRDPMDADEAELNLERVIDRVTVVTYGRKETAK